jgi:uncharacterized protein YegL
MTNSTSLTLRENDLIDNPVARVAVSLVLDCSSSMSGEPIKELNKGVEQFFNEVKNNVYAKDSVEVCVVTFGNTADCLLDFDNIERQTPPSLTAFGNTPMDDAVNIALDKLNKRKKEYKDNGVSYYQPWMVLMTDGQPTQDISGSSSRTKEMINNKKLTIFPIGIGHGADMNELARFSPDRDPLRLNGLKFESFFEWLSQSVERVSQSIPGDKIDLDLKGIKGWAEL